MISKYSYILIFKFYKAHEAPITKIQWVNPIFGNVIVSLGADNIIKIWKETIIDSKICYKCISKIIIEKDDIITDFDICPQVNGKIVLLPYLIFRF